MKTYCLASSSSGNCFILEFEIQGQPIRIMIECGLPIGEIYKKCNENQILLSSINACLITHAHSDHCKSAKIVSELGIPLFASKSTLELINCKGNELILEKPNRVLNGLYVMPFAVEHDIEGAVGFIIKTEKECVFFANDHKRWTANLKAFKPNFVFIECNYEQRMVYTQLSELKNLKKKGIQNPYEEEKVDIKIKQHERNINSHCSLRGTEVGLSKLDLSKCQAIFLMHLSDRYANEYKMKNDIESKFCIKTYVAKKNGGLK